MSRGELNSIRGENPTHLGSSSVPYPSETWTFDQASNILHLSTPDPKWSFFYSSLYKYHLCRSIFEELFIGWTHCTRSSCDLRQCLLFIFTCNATSLSAFLYGDSFSSNILMSAVLHSTQSVSHRPEHLSQTQPHQQSPPALPRTWSQTAVHEPVAPWLALTFISSC